MTRLIAQILFVFLIGFFLYRVLCGIRHYQTLSPEQKKKSTPAPLILECVFYLFGIYAAFSHGF